MSDVPFMVRALPLFRLLTFRTSDSVVLLCYYSRETPTFSVLVCLLGRGGVRQCELHNRHDEPGQLPVHRFC